MFGYMYICIYLPAQGTSDGRGGEWAEGDVGGAGGSASSLASEQLEESLSVASLAEVGSDWQLAVDSLTSSMDSSVGVHPLSLPNLSSAPRPPPPPPPDQPAEEDQQLTGQLPTTLSKL